MYRWQRGIFLNRFVYSYNISFYNLLLMNFGLNFFYLKFIYKRLELNNKYFYNRNITLQKKKQYIKIGINLLISSSTYVYGFSKFINVFEIIRYYLIFSYKGKCHMLGKPSNGQRTWSNAWSSFKTNLTTRRFIHSLNSTKNINKKKKNKPIKKNKSIVNWF